MKKSRQHQAPTHGPLAIFLLLTHIVIAELAANPSGEVLVHGNATFSRSVSGTPVLTIDQSTERAVVNWQDFSIAAGEQTIINQISTQSAILNRVVSSNPSAIHGQLDANGQVFLINQNGILVGATGVINTGSFIASTHDVSDADFMAGGDLTFSGTSTATILNQGTINGVAGDVILIAQQVENTGSLTASGLVSLAGGNEVLLTETPDASGQRVFVKVGGNGTVSNSGLMEGAVAELKAAGGNMYALAVNNDGIIRATGTTTVGGQVWLTAGTGELAHNGTIEADGEAGGQVSLSAETVTLGAASMTSAKGTTGAGGSILIEAVGANSIDGSLEVTGATGGSIRALGTTVDLGATAVLDASGETAGGEILVGGDYQGNNPLVRNATDTTVAAGAKLLANANDLGAGGRVIVWADNSTSFAGHIEARGGANGGAGGFAEVSGKMTFDFKGTVDLSSVEAGLDGNLLLDPDTVEVVNGGGGTLPGPATGNNQIDPATILAAMASGNVTIQANVSITITDDIIGANVANNNLTFDANGSAGSIIMNASTIDIAGGDLSFVSPVTVNTASTELIANMVTIDEGLTGAATATDLTITADEMDIASSLDYSGKTLTLQNRTAGQLIDLGTRTDTTAGMLELSNVELRNISANKLVIGSTSAGNMTISQRITPQNVTTLHLKTGGNLGRGTPISVPFDLTDWSTRGVAGPSDGVWTVNAGGTSVTQSVNAQTPTFFMSDDTSGYINAIFEGTLQVDATTTDNDYIGFVFGAQEPTALGENEFDFMLFDWVQGNFTDKFMLSDVADNNNTGTHSGNDLWTRSSNGAVTTLQTGSNVPWTPGQAYDFRITYTTDNVTAEVRGGAFGGSFVEVINYDAPDPVNSPFVAGDFGFYNFSQDKSTYSNFTLTELPSLEMGVQNLAVSAGGSVDLTERVDVANVAIQAGGDINFQDVNGFNVALVDGVNGISNGANLTSLESNAAVTQSAPIQTGSLELMGSGSSYTFENAANDADLIAADTTALSWTDVDGFAIGSVNTTAGLNVSGITTLSAGGTVSQGDAINTTSLALLGTGGDYQLTNGDNRTGTLAADTTNVTYHENGSYAIGTVGTTSGITTTGNTTLSSTGNVTQSSAINTDGLELLGAGGDYDLTHASNAINTLAGSTGDVDLVNSQSLTIGTVNSSGLSTTDHIQIVTTGASSDIILDQAVQGDTDTNSAATDETVVLAAGDDFDNNVGAGAISTGNGRFLVYSERPDQSDENGLAGNRYYNQSYGANPPASIGGTDDRFLYSHQPTVTITADDLNRTYGAANPALTYTTSGLMSGDSLASVLSGTASLSTTATVTSNVGSYAITTANGSLTALNGYAIALVDGTMTIDKATLTVTADDQAREYGDANPALTLSYAGFVNGDTSADLDTGVSTSTAATAASNVGTYTITAAGGLDNNYDFNYVDGNLTVNRATLTITADDQARTYGAANPALTVSYAGFKNGEDATALTSGPSVSTAATVTSDVGNYAISASGAAATNYDFNYVDGNLAIGKASLTITADNQAREYGDANPALTYAVTGFVNGDSEADLDNAIATSTLANATSNVGTYAITAAAGLDNNYDLTFVDGALTINKATLNITADDQSREYGDANPAFTLTYAGFKNGETSAVLDTAASASSTATVTSNVGAYTIAAAGAVDGNYDFVYTNGTLDITRALLTVTADNQSKTYGDANPALTATYAGFKNGEDATALSTAASLSTLATTASDVGAYTISAGGAAATNYDFAYADGTLDINKAALTITADNQVREYGDANPLLTYSLTGLVNGDTEAELDNAISISTLANATSNVGAYAISTTAGLDNNYDLTFVDGTLTINRAMLQVTADDQLRTYGSANPALTATITGYKNGEDASVFTTGPSVTTVANAGSNVGTYAITAAGAAATNYDFTYTDGTLTIDKATLTITADDQARTYGTANPALTATYAGFVNGENTSVLTSGPSISTAATATSSAGSYAISVGGATATNYDFVYNPGTLTVGKATLTITADDLSRLYGSANPGFTFSYSGFVNGDDASDLDLLPSGGTTATQSSDTGTYTIVAAGASSTNYDLVYVDGLLTVNRAPLTITADPLQKFYGDPNPTLTATYTGLVNGDTDVDLDTPLSLSTLATLSSDVGTYDITLSGAVDSNYDITLIDGNLTIDQAVITVSTGDYELTYGEDLPDITIQYDGFKLGETLAVLDILPTVENASGDAGTFNITVSGGLDNNYTFAYAGGTLTVNKAPLLLVVDDLSRTYGSSKPDYSLTAHGFVRNDSLSDLDEVGTFESLATYTSDVGRYEVRLEGTRDSNYSITTVAGELTITQAPLHIAARDLIKGFGYGIDEVDFEADFIGLVANDTPEDLDQPLLFRVDAEQISPNGRYEIIPYNAADKNYVVTFSNAWMQIGETKIDDFVLTREPGDRNPRLLRTFGGTAQGGFVRQEFSRMYPEKLYPPPEFPARLADRGMDTISTQIIWTPTNHPYRERDHDYDVTEKKYVHEAFKVSYRSRAQEFNLLYEGKETYDFEVMTKSSYHEFIQNESALADAGIAINGL